ncbi:hypothetical protein [Enterococcus pallens]|uniref:Uncharacterized protein n=1 Tax=Enterococcus pallens ATCC BAA-351 TaxID=1158607 RepID=R2T210_9ENTE|nr:hypothetical protein [Enterococcus pallens]EOH94299.1 hypothetical protein UAU_02034 [Enterococcus pallens ATCC BAA-351]EOU24178.1 hypothetical protein I588_00165 [Enterococcus pallens ATCC BAA-351]OJG82047.1 hypothetical protein RV10_GL001911 [Enterococcus pallens]
MSEKSQPDIIKEQISFIEARITRYEELRDGSMVRRILFGAGNQSKLGFLGLVIGFILLIYALLHYSEGLEIGLVGLLSVLLLSYSLIQLNVIRKKNGPERFDRMVKSLTQEKSSMEKELQRICAAEKEIKKQ